MKVRSGVAELTLQDEARRNSFNPELVAALAEACGRLQLEQDVRVVVLRSRGPVFSAGGDLDSLASTPKDPLAVYRGVRALAALPMPTIGVVRGAAIGAGVSLVLACDVVVATLDATFDPRFLDLAIHPGGGHLWRLQRRIGRQATAALILFGERLSAEEAERVGLIWRAVPEERVDDAVGVLVDRVVNRSPAVVRRTKVSLDLLAGVDEESTAVELEQIAQSWSVRQPEHREAVAALRARVRG